MSVKNLFLFSTLALLAGCASKEKSIAAKGQEKRNPASLIEIRCENLTKDFVLVENFATENPYMTKKTLNYAGSQIEFTYYSNVKPEGSPGIITWIAQDGSYVETRGLTYHQGKFVVYFNAKKQKTVTALVSCEEKLDGQ